MGNGLLHPDVNLLFNLTSEGVPYQLLQTVAIAILGTVIGGILAIPFSFLACDKIVPKWVAVIFRAVILGILINEFIGWRDYESLGAVLLALFVVVFIIENTSQYLRKKLS